MGRMVVFVSVGDVLLDVLVERGADPHAATTNVRPGGSAANAAAWAAAAGASARCVGRIGDDLAGAALRTALERRGVEACLSVDETLPTGVATEVDGDTAVDRGATASLRPEHVRSHLDGDALLVSGHLLSFAETAPAAAEALAGSTAAWTAVDAGGSSPAPDQVADASALFLDGSGHDDPVELARAHASRHRLVCVTLGPAGAVGVLDGETARASPPSIHPGRARGAGDAFAAGVLVALAGGATLDGALAAGCALGAAAAGARDGWPPPSA